MIRPYPQGFPGLSRWIGFGDCPLKVRRCLQGLVLLLLVWNLVGRPVQAGPLADRMAHYPHWQGLPPTQSAQGDLPYPPWFEGQWIATSTLTDLEAPLAPEIVSPGFEGNRRYLNQGISFAVRFGPPSPIPFPQVKGTLGPGVRVPVPTLPSDLPLVADRQFNGEHIAQAYLGADAVESVQVDPQNPNRQITQLSQGLALVSVVTDRAWEWQTENSDRYLSTELSQQFFRGNRQVYLNRVETTTDYRYEPDRSGISATQITAIYLSPQDPQYFEAVDRPVALYRYHLDLMRPSPEAFPSASEPP